MNTNYQPQEEVIQFFVKSQKDGIDLSCGHSVDSLENEIRTGTNFGRRLYQSAERLHGLAVRHNLLSKPINQPNSPQN